MFLLIFSVLSVSEKAMLKLPIIIVSLSVSPTILSVFAM